MSIGKFAKNLILTTDLSNTQILERVLEAFPTAKTSMACIAWYKSDLRKKGQLAKPGAAPILSLEQKLERAEKKVQELQAALEAAEAEWAALVEESEVADALAQGLEMNDPESDGEGSDESDSSEQPEELSTEDEVEVA